MLCLFHQIQYQVRVGAISEVFIPFRFFTNPRVIALLQFHIGDYLKMEVWGPVSVFGRLAEMSEALSAGDELSFADTFQICQT